MSHYMTALAMKQRGLKPAAKIVLYWLADHHNETTGACFPSLKTLAQECEMDVASIKRHLANLEVLGLIQRTQRQRENGSQTSTQYTLHLLEPLAQNAPAPSANCATPLAQNNTPLNLGINNLGKEQDHLVEKVGFLEFWERAPNKVAKAQSRKTWDKLTPAQREAAHENVTDWYYWFRKTYPTASMPHPSTYLAQRRWEDEGWKSAQTQSVDRAAFWAESIKAGRYVSPATCPPALCAEMVQRGLVTSTQLKERGLAA